MEFFIIPADRVTAAPEEKDARVLDSLENELALRSGRNGLRFRRRRQGAWARWPSARACQDGQRGGRQSPGGTPRVGRAGGRGHWVQTGCRGRLREHEEPVTHSWRPLRILRGHSGRGPEPGTPESGKLSGDSIHRPGPRPIYLAKGVRVFFSGLLSIVLPFYLTTLGYGPLFQGLVLAAILAGNAFSNIAVTYLNASVGVRRLLQSFSLLMVLSGAVLAVSTSAWPLIIACFVGNISSTGTESGPFQSIEAGTLPDLAPSGAAVKAFGKYNLIGYSAAALGQLASAAPGALGNSHVAFQAVFAGFSLAGAGLFAVYSRTSGLNSGRAIRPGLSNLGSGARKDVARLSALFSLDAFGGVFVTTYLLSIWFNSTFGLQLEALGTVFFVASVVAAASTYGASIISLRIGNLRTMVYTHLASSGLLIAMGLAGSLAPALAFLFLRQSLSQMDVPTRQALMTEMFRREERVQAYAVTNIARSTGSFVGGPIAAGILGLEAVAAVPFVGGGVKIVYDLLTFASYRRKYR